MAAAEPTRQATTTGPAVFDRRRGECFHETVLGDGMLRLAY